MILTPENGLPGGPEGSDLLMRWGKSGFGGKITKNSDFWPFLGVIFGGPFGDLWLSKLCHMPLFLFCIVPVHEKKCDFLTHFWPFFGYLFLHPFFHGGVPKGAFSLDSARSHPTYVMISCHFLTIFLLIFDLIFDPV